MLNAVTNISKRERLDSRNQTNMSAWQRRKEYSQKLKLSTPRAKASVGITCSPKKRQEMQAKTRNDQKLPWSSRTCRSTTSVPSKDKLPKSAQPNLSMSVLNSKVVQAPKTMTKRRSLQSRHELPVLSTNMKTRQSPKSKKPCPSVTAKDVLARSRRVSVLSVKPQLMQPPKISTRPSAIESQKKQPNSFQRKVPVMALAASAKTSENQSVSRRTQGNPSEKIEAQRNPRAGQTATKRPLTNLYFSLANTEAAPNKRIRRRSFTLSSGKENENVNRNRPVISKAVAEGPQMLKRQSSQMVNKTASIKSFETNAMLQTVECVPVVEKTTVQQAEASEQTPAREPLMQVTESIESRATAQPTGKIETFNPCAFKTLMSMKRSAKTTGTPIVRLPIRERLALWRERKSTGFERRKTFSSVNDVFNASRHERCFVTEEPTYSCPYGKRKQLPKRPKVTKKENFQVVENRQLFQEEKENISVANMEEFPEDIQDALIELQTSLINGASVQATSKKLSDMMKRTQNIEKHAHYWKVLALIEERHGNANAAMKVYETAARNGAEPVEVITEAVEAFIERLEEATEFVDCVSDLDEPAAGKSLERSKRKKRVSVDSNNAFESTLIEYAIKNSFSFVTKLGNFFNMGAPAVEKYAVPVRRSARLSKSVQRTSVTYEHVNKKPRLLFVENESLLYDE